MATTAKHLPQRHKLTVTDYCRLGDAGSFGVDDRVELIEGEVIDMAPIGIAHASLVDHLNDLFTRAVGDRAQVRVQNPARLETYSEPQPDLLLLKRRSDFYRTGHPEPADILLVVEVADTSLVYDRDTKIPLYARHGIPEAWLVDVVGERLTVYQHPGPDGYPAVTDPAPLEKRTLVGLPEVAIDLQGLFQPGQA